MVKTKSVNILRLARFQAILFAMIGLVAGVLYSFGGAVFDVVTTGAVNWGTALAFLALIGMPIVFALGGAILGLVEAMLFNLVARRLGGIEIDFG